MTLDNFLGICDLVVESYIEKQLIDSVTPQDTQRWYDFKMRYGDSAYQPEVDDYWCRGCDNYGKKK